MLVAPGVMSAFVVEMKIKTQLHIMQAAIVDLAVVTLMLASSWSMVDTVASGLFDKLALNFVMVGSLFLLVVLYHKTSLNGRAKVK